MGERCPNMNVTVLYFPAFRQNAEIETNCHKSPTTIYLLKVNSGNTEKRYEYVQS